MLNKAGEAPKRRASVLKLMGGEDLFN